MALALRNSAARVDSDLLDADTGKRSVMETLHECTSLLEGDLR